MKRNIYFSFIGILVGAVIFWAPSIFGGGDFGGIVFFDYLSEMFPKLWNHWLLPGIPYVVLSIIPFSLYGFFFYRRSKDKFSSLFYNFIFFTSGLYVSLSLFFFLLGLSLARGGF